MSDATDATKRYEAVLHTPKGIHTLAFFNDLDGAHGWIIGRYSELHGSRAAVIYDQQQDRKRVFALDPDFILVGK